MFRQQQNAFDDAVGKLPSPLTYQWLSAIMYIETSNMLLTCMVFFLAKATDENLTSENWEYILVGDLAWKCLSVY